MEKIKKICQELYKQPWIVVFCNVLLVMVLFSLQRLAYYWINIDMYPNITSKHLWEIFGGGVRFDMTAVFYLNSVYVVLSLLPLRFRENPTYQKVTKWFYFIPNVFGILANSIDTIYTRFSARRTTVDFFTEFANDGNLFNIFFQSLFQYWYLTLITIAFILILWYGYRAIKCADTSLIKTDKPYAYYIEKTLILCVTAYFYVIGIRGSFGGWTNPINMIHANAYANDPSEVNIVLNTPFTLMMSWDMADKYACDEFYASNEELESVMSPIHIPADTLQESKKNVVLFILESFSKEYSGFLNPHLDNGTYKGFMPFLDSIISQSVTYHYSFASGRKSIDAMPSILSSIPMLYSNFFVSIYSTNHISSVADALNQLDYNTTFFHGGPNGSMGFQGFARNAKFQAYYGMTEYNNSKDFDGTWAIWDEEFLQYWVRSIGEMPQPFLTSCFTASSHHPFKVPKRYEGVFPKGDQEVHQCIGYSDNAIRLFFEEAKKQPWFNNTLFVFTADHTNGLSHPEYRTAKGLYEVPIVFYSPAGDLTPEVREDVVSQTDIMPSILGYLGYNKPYFAFGEDALTQPKKHPYAICYNSPVFQIFSNHLLVQFDGKKVTHIFDFKKDNLLQNNELDNLLETEEVQDMVAYLKAYIQQYVERMNSDKLTINNEHK